MFDVSKEGGAEGGGGHFSFVSRVFNGWWYCTRKMLHMACACPQQQQPKLPSVALYGGAMQKKKHNGVSFVFAVPCGMFRRPCGYFAMMVIFLTTPGGVYHTHPKSFAVVAGVIVEQTVDTDCELGWLSV